jgi:GTP-binding protein
MAQRLPVIAIIGRPNVGKSTLFNRILGKRVAIVEDEPGVTRDRNYAVVDRFSIPFLLVDTGGLDFDTQDDLTKMVVGQSLLAAEQSDKLIVLFDAASGCQSTDLEVIQSLRRFNNKAVYVANKCDGEEQSIKAVDFYQLGLDHIHNISALHGRRVVELIEGVLKTLPDYQQRLKLEDEQRKREEDLIQLAAANIDPADFDLDEDETFAEDQITDAGRSVFEPEADHQFPEVFVAADEDGEEREQSYLKENRVVSIHKREEAEEKWDDAGDEEDELPEVDVVRVAIVGRPNAGKSTLLNLFVGEERAITSPVAGTTRDSLEVEIIRDGRRFIIVDTAGIRKPSRVDEGLERYAVTRSLAAIADCDVAVIVIDAVSGPSDQDAKIAGLAHEQGKGLIIAVNKWDLVEKDHKTVKRYTDTIFEQIRFAQYAPVVFTSALSGRRCVKILDNALDIAVQRMRKLKTGRLNRIIRRTLSRSTLPFYRGRPIKLLYAAQIDTAPPRIALFMNYPRGVHFSVLRHIKNVIRKEYGFDGTDIKLVVTKRRERVAVNG